jgi:transposase InsO family protein
MDMAYTTNPRLPRVRMEAVRLVKYRGWSTRQVARHTGYSQSAIVKWCKKDTSGGWRPIPTKSSRPKHHPKQLKESIVRKIISLRFETRGRCSEVIHKMLLNDGINASLNSVKRILDRHGLINKRSPWKRYHPPTERPEALNPGDLIQVDTIHLMIEKKRIYVFTLIDVFSRWCYARAYERANCKTALHFLRLAQFYARFKFKNIQSDHGSEFSTHFTERVKINHRHSRVRKPNDNGHLERFNRTLQEECLRKLKVDVNVINKELPKYLKYYNERRLHLGINLQTPLQVITSY